MIKRIELRQQLNILALFMIVQFGGLILASLVFSTTPLTSLASAQNNGQINTPAQALWFFVYFIVATLVILLIFKVYHGDVLFRLLEGFVIVVSSLFVFLVILDYLFPNIQGFAPILALLLAVLLIILKNKQPKLRNTVAIIASMGVGLVLGLDFGFSIAYILVVVIAIYDYVAVFVTKHMLTLAKAVSSRGLAFLIGSTDIEVIPKGFFNKEEAKEYEEYKKELRKIKNPIIKNLIKKGKLPLISQIQLGAGDLGIPLMLAISSYKIAASYFLPVCVAIGAVFGMIYTIYIQKKFLIPLPAIPPLFSFMSMALGLALLPAGFRYFIIFFAIGIGMLGIFTLEAKRTSRHKT
ncbi:MAG: presenilin family intramembrane aspartyl protease [Candidatus Micrarchaeia archaeon]